ncbi:MAG: universal stress protein UspA [Anaerolineaceae bacterium]|nr:universal stress protein UspA [Anaerolineaceae bacterium]
MLNHILIPLDQSELAETALEYASKLVGPDSRITLLTVIVPPDISFAALYNPADGVPPNRMETTGSFESLERQVRVQAEDYLRRVGTRLSEKGVKVDILVQVGQDAETIVENAANLNVDGIVMATHGRSGISRWLLGSVTQKVLGAAHCPVIVIPNRRRHPADKAES